MLGRLRLLAAVGVLGLSLAICGCQGAMDGDEDATATYVTRYGLGPDKWASAWLLTRHIYPGAELHVSAYDAEVLEEGIPFDLPDAALKRSGDRATFASVLETYGVEDPIASALGRIVHEIEVEFWSASSSHNSNVVEDAFRALQRNEGRMSVTPECYLRFFESVYAALNESVARGGPLRRDEFVQSCSDPVGKSLRRDRQGPVAEMPIRVLLNEIRNGKDIVFVDVRESKEFAESHIPGALNIPIHDVDEVSVARLRHADYVVSYCVKDFRGYEMAKRLHSAGVESSVILNPYGIKGWVASGLPVTGSESLEASEAERKLRKCVENLGCEPGERDA